MAKADETPEEIGRRLHIKPCAECGEFLGGRYVLGGKDLCWECYSKHTGANENRQAKPARPRKTTTKTSRRPGRDQPLPVWRNWLSDTIGLPPEVRVETVTRNGPDDADPLTITLSNGIRMRCAHQKRLHAPTSLQAFVASSSNGIAQPERLTPAQAGDVFVALCVIGTTPAAIADPAADLREHLEAFVKLGESVHGSLDYEHRYTTILALKNRPSFDRAVADGMRMGAPTDRPVVLADPTFAKRYVRASEWITYLRHVVGQTVDPSALAARMLEIGCERSQPQAWNADRSNKVNLVFYSIPADL